MVLSTLPGDRPGLSSALPSAVLTNTRRIGWQFIEVGPNFIASYSAASVASSTGRSMNLLAVWASPKAAAKAKAKAPEPDDVTPNKPLGFELQSLDTAHPYFTERGLSAECVTHFGIGHCQKGSMTGRIVIPIHNADGQLVAYAGRWPGTPPDEDTPKYKLPPAFHKSRELFNAHRAFAEPDTSPLVIVEGYFDCVRLWQHGIRRVVALMGSSLSQHQEELIRKNTNAESCVLLMLDEDDAGKAARDEIAVRLSKLCFVKTFVFHEAGKQPEALSSQELEQIRGGLP